MKYLAPGKVNFGLWVIKKRGDGYHDIVTVFHKIPFYDEITIEESDEFRVRCVGCPEGKGNSVYRAYSILKEKTNTDIKLRVKIKKRIPMQAGLGGGSSDAATFIKALNEFYNLRLSMDEMIEIGRSVGADVPFFLLDENAAIGEGLGDRLTPFVSRLNGLIEIYKPSFGVSTGWAYSLIDALSIYTNYETAMDKAVQIMESLKNGELFSDIENVFEKIVVGKYPELQEYKEKSLKNGALLSLLSGSGSCMFSVFKRSHDLRVRYIEDL